MTRIALPIVYYIAVLVLIWRFHTLSPTNLAGFGLDVIVIYLLIPIISIGMLVRSLKKVNAADRGSRLIAAINWVGIALTAIAIYLMWVL